MQRWKNKMKGFFKITILRLEILGQIQGSKQESHQEFWDLFSQGVKLNSFTLTKFWGEKKSLIFAKFTLNFKIHKKKMQIYKSTTEI